jgi:MerR family transcriptional regulator, light-induced transcriptional regulator
MADNIFGMIMTSRLDKNKSIDNEPLFNIGAVSRMTGISMANLRAWELRYNFPEAKRTKGGHRLYSEYDLYKLQWVKTKIKSGMQTASAIHLFQKQEQTNQLELTNPDTQDSGELKIEENHTFSVIKPNFINALVNKNLSKADEILGNLLAAYSPEDLLIELITPVLSEMGEKWQTGEISISDEHLATNYLRHRMLMWMVSSPPAKTDRPILLACAPQEWHEGSLLILGTLLRRRQWPIVYLGQALPLPDLAKFIEEIKPSLVVLVAMMEESAKSLEDLPQYIPFSNEFAQPIISYGGKIFVSKPELREKMSGHYLGDTFLEGINNIEHLIKSSFG